MDNKTCKEIMTRNPECCEEEDSVTVAVNIMKDLDCGIVPVVSSHSINKIVGVVTDRDICMYTVGNDLQPSNVAARDCMTPTPITCREDVSVSAAISLMKEHSIRRLVITDDDNRVTGVLSQSDIVARNGEEPAEICELLQKILEKESIK